jgi:hypothetical protein
MGFFEWFGEIFNPGPVGNIGRQDNDAWQPKNKFTVWFLTVLGVVLFGFLIWAVLQSDEKWQWLIALVIYLLLSWFASPKPAYSNIGWARGLIDNPFRISDDFNRWLALFALMLVPGKIIIYAAQTIHNTIRAL